MILYYVSVTSFYVYCPPIIMVPLLPGLAVPLRAGTKLFLYSRGLFEFKTPIYITASSKKFTNVHTGNLGIGCQCTSNLCNLIFQRVFVYYIGCILMDSRAPG